MEIVFSIIYALLTFCFLIIIILKNKKNKFVGAYSGFTFGYTFFYSFIPLLIKINYEKMDSSFYYINKYLSRNESITQFTTLGFIILGFIVFNCFYNISRNGNNNLNNISSNNYISLFSNWGIATLIIGGLSFGIFIISFGGIQKILSIAEMKRSFNVSLSKFGSYEFSLFSIPARLITISPFIFTFLILSRKKTSDKVWFVISFIFSILFYMFNAGKAPLLSFLLCFLYYYFNKHFKISWKLIIFLGLLSLPLLDFLDNLFFYFSYGTFNNINIDYMRYIYQFSFPYITFSNAQNIVSLLGLRYGTDFITAFLNFLPGINFSISYEITSQFYNGENWKSIGGVPNDFLTFSYLQFSVFGIIIVTSITGLICGKIDKGLSIMQNHPAKEILSSATVVYLFFLIQSADFEALLRGGVILVVISVIIIKIQNKRGNIS